MKPNSDRRTILHLAWLVLVATVFGFIIGVLAVPVGMVILLGCLFSLVSPNILGRRMLNGFNNIQTKSIRAFSRQMMGSRRR